MCEICCHFCTLTGSHLYLSAVDSLPRLVFELYCYYKSKAVVQDYVELKVRVCLFMQPNTLAANYYWKIIEEQFWYQYICADRQTFSPTESVIHTLSLCTFEEYFYLYILWQCNKRVCAFWFYEKTYSGVGVNTLTLIILVWMLSSSGTGHL